MSFVWRFLASLVLAMATYNPTGFSFVGWVWNTESLGPEHFVVGVVLAIGWVILFASTRRSLDTLGMILVVALLGGLVWLLIDFGLLDMESVSAMTWVVLVCLSALLATGLCWSHIWRRLTGQYEFDDDGQRRPRQTSLATPPYTAGPRRKGAGGTAIASGSCSVVCQRRTTF